MDRERDGRRSALSSEMSVRRVVGRRGDEDGRRL
jgi:hypothetical protein